MFWKLLLTGCAAVSLALAQPGMGGGGQGGMGGGGMDGGGTNAGGGRGEMGGMVPGGQTRAQKLSKFEMMVQRLKLNKDQTNEAGTILESTSKDATPMVRQLLEARQNLATALITGKSDAEIDPLVKALSEAQFQMTGVEVKPFQRIVGLLKPNQVAKAPEAFDLMAEIFMPSPPAGGRGGMGGGTGGMGGGGGRRDGGGR